MWEKKKKKKLQVKSLMSSKTLSSRFKICCKVQRMFQKKQRTNHLQGILLRMEGWTQDGSARGAKHTTFTFAPAVPVRRTMQSRSSA